MLFGLPKSQNLCYLVFGNNGFGVILCNNCLQGLFVTIFEKGAYALIRLFNQLLKVLVRKAEFSNLKGFIELLGRDLLLLIGKIGQ